VEGSNTPGCRVSDECGRFPRLILRAVTLPIHQVLQLATEDARVEDSFDDKLFHAIASNHRGRERLNATRKSVRGVGIQQGDVENRMDIEGRR